jgi:hypothetical protein
MEGQRFLALYHDSSKRDVAICSYIQSYDQFNRLECSASLSRSFENELNCGCLGACRGNIASYLSPLPI